VRSGREQLEQALLSAALSGPSVMAEIEAAYGGSPFREINTSRIWSILCEFRDVGKPFDFELVGEAFVAMGGDASYLIHVGNHPHEIAHIDHYCGRLREIMQGEQAQLLGAQLLRDQKPDIDEYIQKLDSLRSHHQAELVTQAQAIEAAEQARKNPLAVHPTRIAPLDELLNGGLRAGQLVVVGGRPGSGKSVLMMQMLLGNVSSAQAGLVVSLEMLAREMVDRLSKRYRPEALAALNLRYIDSTSSLAAILALVKVTAQRMNLCGIVVDYLQLLEVAASGREGREREIAKASRQMKRLAMDLQVPVILGSQLNRNAEKSGKPSLHDLRESGAIEQDADIVILLHRDSDTGKGTAEVAKHRGGRTGRIDLQLDGPRFQFVVEDKFREYDSWN